MIDIPRNELLDKLAAGWKVRTKAYGKNTLNTLEELQGIDLKCFIEDDWEGEPGLPQLYLKNVSAQVAFRQLKSSATKFICRTAWPAPKQITFIRDNISLSIDDVLADDWEVWD